MKSIIKKIITISTALLLIFTTSCTKNRNEKQNVLKISTCNEVFNSCRYFISNFSKKNPNLKIKIDIYNCNSLKYKLRHQMIDTDIVLLDDILSINQNTDQFVDLTNSEDIYNYSSYINNFLSADDNKMYCLPSPGYFYMYCFNNDLVNKTNVSIPTNISDLLEIAKNLKNNSNYQPFVSSFSQDNYFFDAFMQITIPTFFSSVNGINFFKNFIKGSTTFNESDLKDTFLDTIHYLYDLTLNEFYTTPISQEKSIEKFFNQESIAISINDSFDFEKYYENYNSTFDYSFVPFLSTSSDNSWVCSSSDHYLAIMKNNYNKNKNAIDDFASAYSSIEGQNNLMKDLNGESKKNAFSYNIEFEFSFDSHYSTIQNVVQQGGVFLIDKFISTFNDSISSIQNYAFNQIPSSTLIDDLDTNNKLLIDYQNNYYIVEKFNNLKNDTRDNMERSIEIISSGIKNLTGVDVLMMNNNFLMEPIYNGLIYEKDLKIVFNENVNLKKATVKGASLKKLLDINEELLESNIERLKNDFHINKQNIDELKRINITYVEHLQFNENSFTMNGAYIKDGKYYLSNKMLIQDDLNYYIGLPEKFIEMIDVFKIGDNVNCLQVYKNYLESKR